MRFRAHRSSRLAKTPRWPRLALSIAAVGAGVSQTLAQPQDFFSTPSAVAGRPDQGASEVTVSAEASTTKVAPGGTFVIAIVLDHADGWHSNLHEPIIPPEFGEFPAVPTTITPRPEAASPFAFGPVQWPEPYEAKVDFLFTGDPVGYLVYHGRAIAYLPVKVAADAPMSGTLSLPVAVGYQACNDQTCLIPATEVKRLEVEIVRAADAAPSRTDGDFAGFDASVFDNPAAWGDTNSTPINPTTTDPEPESSSADSRAPASGTSGSLLGLSLGGGLIPLAILSFLGGAILNLTPCVLPMIPIKIMTLSQHAGEHKSRSLVLGVSMFLGVTAFWAALGLPVVLLSSFGDPSRLFGYWFVTIPVGALIVLMSLGMMGLFTITLPQKTYAWNPKADNVFGSFLFGLLTAVFGLPCFGFVAGALIPAAISLGDAAVLTIFTAMGLGMGAPYLVLSAFPGLVKRVPRTGPASELVKQVLGLLMGGFGLFFVGTGLRALVKTYPYTADSLHVYALTLLIVAAGFWLALQTFKITKSPAKRGVFGLVGLALAAVAVYTAVGSTQTHRADYLERQAAIAAAGGSGPGVILPTVWNAYTPATLEKALDEGMIAFVDFTADWCINCKVFEANVLNKEPVRSVLRSDEVAMIQVDLSAPNPDGEKLLDDLGRVGIPTWAVIGPRAEDVRIVTNYTPQAVLQAIEAARGKAVAVGD